MKLQRFELIQNAITLSVVWILLHAGSHAYAQTLIAPELPIAPELDTPIEWLPELTEKGQADSVEADSRSVSGMSLIDAAGLIESFPEKTFSENFDDNLQENPPHKVSEASATLPLIPTGFLRSRWAMSDPHYAAKYAKGASKKNLPRKIKQAADARFVEKFAGWYLSAGLTAIGDTPAPLGSLELGYTGYQTSYLTNRVGFIAAFNDEDFYVGAETGVRLQTPTRLAPFVGLGLFAGASSTRSPAEHDNVDNDDDGAIDEDGETEFDFDGALAAIYPEAGFHFWWTPRIRLSGFGRYMITTEGRRADSNYFGASIAFLSR